ncbi:MAG: triose-phosphate isomerase [Gammaproteobacteria bacterium]|jgi:triosephosphate isomerase|nr:triose-phosphate isomerase [Gammaproteobacteria bacterium]MDP6094567.1 triose-phosphate isomerase [Gammaproteobacteria bacterium]MDP7455094.1 triose-phosphate isomerase [Gammaproteobacteria bacterium]HJO11889.1 triose-phosphate isomerase [Gammaproteobacteria bacterium]|tara:strand:+ start:5549 stop:6304 length:756 start_codon:yes stop_codon:yes gene_type:complete
MRQSLVVGNWKMHGSRAAVKDLLGDLLSGMEAVADNVDVAVCPTAMHLGLATKTLQNSPIELGAQNVHSRPEGAYTGEISAPMLADYNVKYVIVGHSERRAYFAESDELVAEKFSAVQAEALTPILCLGESLQQRQEGITDQVILGQLDAVLEAAGISAFDNAVIAYEPVWAIGTGQTATPDQAQEVHQLIRGHLAGADNSIAAQIRVIYGGSVKADNANELFSRQDIDGGLVGGAALKASEFISICKSVD